MPENLIVEVFSAVIDILRISLITAIPAFIFTLIAVFLHKKLVERFDFSWIKSAFVSTYAVVTVVVAIIYLFPFLLGFLESPLSFQPQPEIFQNTALDYLKAVIFSLVKVLINGFVFSIVLLPLIFLGTYIFEKLNEKFEKLHQIIKMFVSVYCTALVAWLILLFVFPWLLTGLFFLLYWG